MKSESEILTQFSDSENKSNFLYKFKNKIMI